jgi:hypothetical protein
MNEQHGAREPDPVRAVFNLIRQALDPIDLPYETEAHRWGYPEVMARWSRDGTAYNMQAKVNGGPVAYVADFDGAAWQDDERALRRRIVWVPGPVLPLAFEAGQISWTRDAVGELQTFVRRLTSDAVRSELNALPWQYDLLPDPTPSDT